MELNEYQATFKQVYEALITPPILGYSETEVRFILDSDAINTGIEDILLKLGYFSKTFGAELLHNQKGTVSSC